MAHENPIKCDHLDVDPVTTGEVESAAIWKCATCGKLATFTWFMQERHPAILRPSRQTGRQRRCHNPSCDEPITHGLFCVSCTLAASVGLGSGVVVAALAGFLYGLLK